MDENDNLRGSSDELNDDSHQNCTTGDFPSQNSSRCSGINAHSTHSAANPDRVRGVFPSLNRFSIAHVAQQPATEFPCFGKLPTELREFVWKAAIQYPRIISFDIKTNNSFAGSAREAGLPRDGPLPSYCDEFVVTKLQLELLHTNHQSRLMVLKLGPRLFPNQLGYPLVSVNLEIDTIHFGPEFEMWKLQSFASAIGPEKVKQIRFLALEYEVIILQNFGDSWKKAVGNAIEICLLFENLENLTFIAHCAGDGSDRIKSKILEIVQWKQRGSNGHGEDHWYKDAPLANGHSETWGQWATRFMQTSFSAQASKRNARHLVRDGPLIEFMELIGVD